jgi:hypothetical protein
MSEAHYGLESTTPLVHPWIATDYCFNDRASDFDVIGLLVADPDACGEWLRLRNQIRANVLNDGKRSLSWKKLDSDGMRARAYLPFLWAANHICGLAITIAFYRDSFDIETTDLDRVFEAFGVAEAEKWKRKRPNFEHMFRIAYCTAMIVAGLSRPNQAIHWLSDQDAAFANEKVENDTMAAFRSFLNLYLPHPISEIRYSTTAQSAEPLFQEDLLSVPDVMCGAACEIHTAMKRLCGNLSDFQGEFPDLSDRAREFLDWYANRGQWPLKRYFCSFESREGRVPSAGILRSF